MLKMTGNISIVIPALNPGSEFPDYCTALRKLTAVPILIIDDGSRPEFNSTFEACCSAGPDITVIRHDANKGKGRALKTAFSYLFSKENTLTGCVTCDSDGQHAPEDVLRCIDELSAHPNALVLGCRTFNLTHVPWKSRFGNNSMRFLFRLATGNNILDTQTGLRAIPASFMKELLDCPGERFEFETYMLLRTGPRPIIQVPIETVYINGNRETHFDPVKDSLKISAIIVRESIKRFAKFVLASLLSFVVDIGIFSFFYHVILSDTAKGHLIISTVVARAISIVFNYSCNRYFVFSDNPQNKDFGGKKFAKYISLALCIVCASYFLTKFANLLFPSIKIEITKACIDLLLFFTSYGVQRILIFPKS